MAPGRDTKAAGKAFCIAAGGEGSPVIAGGALCLTVSRLASVYIYWPDVQNMATCAQSVNCFFMNEYCYQQCAAGEALVVEQPAAQSTPEADPLFAPPTLMSSGTGARVLFTTAELDHNKPITFKAATLHVWNRLEPS